jgi:uncharacterized protein YndB with AHSA1/START domain
MSNRMIKSWSVEVKTQPGRAFEYLTDIAKHAEWSPKPFRVEPVPTLPLKHGDKFQSFGWAPGDKDHVNDVEVTDIDSPRRLVLTSIDDGKRYVSQFDVEATDHGARITRTVDAPKPTGMMALLFPLIFVLFIKPEVEKGMQMLQENLSNLDSMRA